MTSAARTGVPQTRPRHRAALAAWAAAAAVVLAALPGSAAPLPAGATGTSVAGARVVDERRTGDRGLELTITTTAFAEPTQVRVLLPVGYASAPARRWPVTYYVAGTNHREDDFEDQYGGEQLTRAYPSIVVSPRGDSGYWSDWVDGGPGYETFVVDQLVPLVDRLFRTVPGRHGRAVLGESMGGYGALMLAARNPDVFAAAASVSGAVDTNAPPVTAAVSASPVLQGARPDAIYGPRATQEVRWRGHNPWDLAENLRTVDVQVRTADGVPNAALGEGPADLPGCALEVGVHDASVSLHQRLVALRVPHVWRDYGSACHSVPNFQRQIRDSLERFRAVLGARRAPAQVSHLAVEPAVDVFGWRLRADRARALEFLRLERAGRSGLTLTGSGRTTVTTPASFRAGRVVDVVAGSARQRVVADRAGRVTFTVDLGPANRGQQYAPGVVTAARSVRVVLAAR